MTASSMRSNVLTAPANVPAQYRGLPAFVQRHEIALVQEKPLSSPLPVYKPAAAMPVRQQVPGMPPPVYRPVSSTPVQPKILQQQAVRGMPPPVYRPTAQGPIQSKTIAPQFIPGMPPPVYRPASLGLVQPKIFRLQAKPGTPPPVYRPQDRIQRQTPDRMLQPGFSFAPPPMLSSNSIQRTKWRFTNGAWVSVASKTTDTDAHPAPAVYCNNNSITPARSDTYDQNTGKYSKATDRGGLARQNMRKRPIPNKVKQSFGERATRTAYSYFYSLVEDEERSNLQGPHVFSFSAKRAMAHLAEEVHGMTIERCIDSKLMPQPRQAYQMLLDLASAKKLDLNKTAIWEWYQEYKQVYNQAKSNIYASRRKEYARAAIELHPLTVYRIGEKATTEEMDNKSESMASAAEDLGSIPSPWTPLTDQSTLNAVDTGYLTTEPGTFHGHYDDMARNWYFFGDGRPPSPSTYAFAPDSPLNPNDSSSEEN